MIDGVKFNEDAVKQIRTSEACASTEVKKMTKNLVKCVETCPEAWGDPKVEATYHNLPFVIFRKVAKELDVVGQSLVEAPKNVEYDASTITAIQMEQVFDAMRKADYDAMAELFPLFVTKCPWGNPKKADTFKNLRVYPQYWSLIQGFQDHMGELGNE